MAFGHAGGAGRVGRSLNATVPWRLTRLRPAVDMRHLSADRRRSGDRGGRVRNPGVQRYRHSFSIRRPRSRAQPPGRHGSGTEVCPVCERSRHRRWRESELNSASPSLSGSGETVWCQRFTAEGVIGDPGVCVHGGASRCGGRWRRRWVVLAVGASVGGGTLAASGAPVV